jgi:lipopolysaccharide transport system permease protein
MQVKIIDAGRKKWAPDFRELFRYRDLFLMLAWRDFKVRYAQTSIGMLWAFIQPAATIAVLSLVFGQLVETSVPYIVYSVAGMSVWTYFSYVITNSGSSIISSQEMVKKIYFPRLIIPLSKAIVGFIDLGITLLILIALMFWYGIVPKSTVWLAPVFLLVGILTAVGAGVWLSALTVRYRDFQHVVPFIVQIGLYVTPVAYPAELATEHLPDWAAGIYYLNPMAGVTQGFRWAIFGGEMPSQLMWISFAMVAVLCISGLIYFRSVEDKIADYV